MGVLFDRKGTGLTAEGNPMSDQDLALLLASMQGGGGISNAMRSLFMRKAIKNRANARERVGGEGMEKVLGGGGGGQPPQRAMMPRPQGGPMPGGNQGPGGGMSLGLGQGGGDELAQLMAMIQQAKGGGGGPGMPPGGGGRGMPAAKASMAAAMPGLMQKVGGGGGAMSPMTAGSPGGAATPAPFAGGALREPGAGVSPTPSGPPGAMGGSKALEPSQRFSASLAKVWTPERIEGLKQMVQSQDPVLRKFAGSIMESLSAKADPSKRWIVAGSNLFDGWRGAWVPKPPEDIFKPYDLSAGEEHHIPYFDSETMEYKEHVVKNEKDYDTQVIMVENHTDNEGKMWYRYMLASKNPQHPTAENVLGPDGNVLLTDKTSRVITEEGISKTSKSKLWDHYIQLGHSATMMDFLDTQLPELEEALSVPGRGKMMWQSLKAYFNKLTSDEFESYSRKVGAVGVAWDVANKYIKQITGAQMSEREANRLLKAIPNPRDNFPEFQAKLKVVREVIRLSTEYYHSLLKDDALAVDEIKKRAQAFTEKLIDEKEASGELQQVNDNIAIVPEEYQSDNFSSEYGYEAP